MSTTATSTAASLANLPYFLTYFVASLVLLGAFLVLYSQVTPIREWTLIRQGNTAAALSLAGATLGFCLPLASAIAHSAGLADMVLWAAVALALQLACFGVARLLWRDVIAGVEGGDMAAAVVLATGSAVLGLLNAACLT